MAKSNTKQKASFKRELIKKQGQKGTVIQHRYEGGKLVEVKTIGTHNVNVAEVKRLLGKKDFVNNPSHYGGADNIYETIKVIRAWGIDKNFCLANTVKYISRAGKKDPKTYLEDLKKAAWYLQDEINELEKNGKK